jgi:hypothetical protein
MVPPDRTPADSTGNLDSLTRLVRESWRGQAALHAQVVASQMVMDNLVAQFAFWDEVFQAMSTLPSLAIVVTTTDDVSDGPSVKELGP